MRWKGRGREEGGERPHTSKLDAVLVDPFFIQCLLARREEKRREKRREKRKREREPPPSLPRAHVQHASVCRFKTLPRVPAKRLLVVTRRRAGHEHGVFPRTKPCHTPHIHTHTKPHAHHTTLHRHTHTRTTNTTTCSRQHATDTHTHPHTTHHTTPPQHLGQPTMILRVFV